MLVAVILLTVVVAAGWMDKTEMNRPSDDTKYQLEIDVRTRVDNQVGTIESKELDFDVAYSDYSEDGDSFLGLASLWKSFGMWDNDFKITAFISVKGPNGFEAEGKETIEQDIGEWGQEWVEFTQFRAFVKDKGEYTIDLKIEAHCPDDNVDHETFVTSTKKLVIS